MHLLGFLIFDREHVCVSDLKNDFVLAVGGGWGVMVGVFSHIRPHSSSDL